MQRLGVNISTTLLGRHQCHRKSFNCMYLLNKVDASRLGAAEVCVYVTNQAPPCDLEAPPPREKSDTRHQIKKHLHIWQFILSSAKTKDLQVTTVLYHILLKESSPTVPVDVQSMLMVNIVSWSNTFLGLWYTDRASWVLWVCSAHTAVLAVPTCTIMHHTRALLRL